MSPEDVEVHDAEVVPEPEESQELVRRSGAAPTLFHTDDPAMVITKATEVASLLADILKRQGLTTRIGGKDHVQVEGWQTTGSMLGVFPVESWTRPVEGPVDYDNSRGPFGYESRYEARTRDGAIVGAGVARCTRAEGRWRTRDDYALLSMAQTRATSKALKAPLGWIVALAGYTATPAEEMGGDTANDGPPFGPTASQDLDETLRRGLDMLVGESDVIVYDAIGSDAGGYIPRIAARAVVHVAAEYKKQHPVQEEADGE